MRSDADRAARGNRTRRRQDAGAAKEFRRLNRALRTRGAGNRALLQASAEADLHWVLDAAFSQAYAWREAGLERPLSVNLSAHDLRDPKLLDRIKGLFATWGTKPESIQFELTESALMEDAAGALEALTRLKRLGVELHIDDFGTGYSSLSYLQRLPVDSIKIDQSFVTNMIASSDSSTIVRSTIELGHNLELDVVAEGVESEAIWARLAALGCDAAQGYFISRPMPANGFGEWESQSRWQLGNPH